MNHHKSNNIDKEINQFNKKSLTILIAAQESEFLTLVSILGNELRDKIDPVCVSIIFMSVCMQ